MCPCKFQFALSVFTNHFRISPDPDFLTTPNKIKTLNRPRNNIYCYNTTMTCAAFITTLLALQSRPSLQQTKPHTSETRPKMLRCDSQNKCPPGSHCLKLFSKFGVCVLNDRDQHTT